MHKITLYEIYPTPCNSTEVYWGANLDLFQDLQNNLVLPSEVEIVLFLFVHKKDIFTFMFSMFQSANQGQGVEINKF